MARHGGNPFGHTQTFRLGKTPGTSRIKMHAPKRCLLVGGALFLFSGMLIVLIALSVTIATHRKFYWGLYRPPDKGTGDGGEGDGDRKPPVDQRTDIPCPLQMEDPSKEDCEAFGCMAIVQDGATKCFLKADAFGYKYRHTTYGVRGVNYSLVYDTSRPSPFAGDVIHNVRVQAFYVTEEILRFKVHDEDRERYQVPVTFPLLRDLPAVNEQRLTYDVVANKTPSGYARIRVLRKDNHVPMLDSWQLIMTEQFLQVTLPFNAEQLYGFGENAHHHLAVDRGSGAMFSRLQTSRGASLRVPGIPSEPTKWRNLAGVHPFYISPKGDGTTFGVLLLNSNAMDYAILGNEKIALTTIGGILDLYFFVGSTPEHAIQLYHKLIGYPFLPPIWALGHQHWARNIATLSDLKSALKQLEEASIPNEAMYLDVAEDSKAFTLRHDYAGVAQLRESGARLVLFSNPAISTSKNTSYLPFEKGLKDDVFVKKGYGPAVADKEGILLGKGLPPGMSAFPDFLKNATAMWWKTLLEEFKTNATDFDGIFLEFNEPAELSSSMAAGADDCAGDERCQILSCPVSRWDDPPYLPLNEFANGSRLHVDTLCMASAQGKERRYRHYDVHSIYGWSQSVATKNSLDAIGTTRSLVLSSSTFPSSGRYCGHVIGSDADWSELKRTTIGVLEMNMFGIPYVGVKAPKESVPGELCSRWTELASFFPISLDSRLHKHAVEALSVPSRLALSMRYQLLAYLYTLFFKVSTEGGTVLRPLLFEFPLDPETYSISDQFMWGPALLISPILEANATVQKYYLPLDEWYEFLTGTHVEGSVDYIQRDVDQNSTVLVHVRAGHVVPVQPSLEHTSGRSKAAYDLLVYPKGGFARGELFLDDGVSLGTAEKDEYDLYSFLFAQNILRISLSHLSKKQRLRATLMNVVFHNVASPPTRVTFKNRVLHQDLVKYNSDQKNLIVAVDLRLHTLDSQNTEVLIQVYGVAT